MALQRTSRTSPARISAQRGDLAAVITARRLELGLSQVELGDLAGVSYRIVHNLEQGKFGTSLERALAVLETLGLHLTVDSGAAPRVQVTPTLGARYGICQRPEPAPTGGDS